MKSTILVLLTVASLAGGCATSKAAQAPESRPPQTVARIAGSVIPGAIGAYGYDLTRLFPGGAGDPNIGEHIPGNLRHRIVYEERIFLFVDARGAEAFKNNPEFYLPGAGGYCLLGLYRRAIQMPGIKGLLPPPGDPEAMTYANGRWYFHGSKEAREEFHRSWSTINARTEMAAKYFDGLEKTRVSAAAR